MNPGLRKSDLVCVNANHFLSTEPFLYSPFANRCVGGFFLFFIAIASLPLQSSPELQLIPSKKRSTWNYFCSWNNASWIFNLLCSSRESSHPLIQSDLCHQWDFPDNLEKKNPLALPKPVVGLTYALLEHQVNRMSFSHNANCRFRTKLCPVFAISSTPQKHYIFFLNNH